MQVKSKNFHQATKIAIKNVGLQKALGNLKTGFRSKRESAIADLPEFEQLTQQAANVKDHVIENLDVYLELFEEKVIQTGGQVHWASDSDEACKAVLDICKKANAKTVTKGKSMVTEEIALNHYLEKNGIQPIETDLGEYILQLREDHPSHIIAPAIHLNVEDVSEVFANKHQTEKTNVPEELMQQAREKMKTHFVKADVGITGANFCVAETGSTVIVTNEGNGDLTQTLPKVHVVVTSIEKVIPNLNDLSLFLRLLARSATGQEFSVYNTLSTGSKQAGDLDGPEEFHVVLLDNGRSKMLGSQFQSMLRCIRCSACMNNCPVYGAVGGHAYGWVYPGPMGSVLSPQLVGIDQTSLLPNASTLCGKCEEVCPVKIPLPKLLRHWREESYKNDLESKTTMTGLWFWNAIALRPSLFRFFTKTAMQLLSLVAGRRGVIKRFPFLDSWFKHREMPAPQGKTFLQQYQQKTKQMQNDHKEVSSD